MTMENVCHVFNKFLNESSKKTSSHDMRLFFLQTIDLTIHYITKVIKDLGYETQVHTNILSHNKIHHPSDTSIKIKYHQVDNRIFF